MHPSYVCRSIIFPYVYTHLVITHIMRMRLFLTGQKGIQSGILFLPDQFCLQEMAAPFFPALSLSVLSFSTSLPAAPAESIHKASTLAIILAPSLAHVTIFFAYC